jgi:hypothetical protein
MLLDLQVQFEQQKTISEKYNDAAECMMATRISMIGLPVDPAVRNR